MPEGHYADEARDILVVDRYSAYKAMAQVKSGVVKLAFCWARAPTRSVGRRRDFLSVGKGWPELVDWAIVWLHRTGHLYRLNRQRLSCEDRAPEFARRGRGSA